MYGVTNDIMAKLEKQIKNKIYREMLQEYQRYKQNTQKQSLPIRNASKRYQTQQQQNQLVGNDKNHDNNNQSQCFSFLPAIKIKTRDTAGNQPNHHYPRKRFQELPASRQAYRHRVSDANRTQFSDSDDEKTHLYLNQCEQIINNLKDISLKQSKKNPGRKSKYINDKKGLEKLETQMYISSTLPKKQKELSSYEIQKRNGPQRRSNSSIFFQNSKKHDNNDNLSNLATKVPIKERQNVYTISPPEGQIEENEPNEQNEQKAATTKKSDKLKQNSNKKKNNSQNQKKKSCLKESQQKDNKSNDKKNQQKNQINDKKSNKEDLPDDDPQQEAKKQRAIVKYLKKVKLLGQQLHQKVQAFKKQQDNEGNENPNPET